MPLDADTPSSTVISVKSSNHSGRSRNRFPCTGSMSLLSSFDVSELGNWSPCTGLRVLRRRMVAGTGRAGRQSCYNDRYIVFCFCITFSCRCQRGVVLDHLSTHRYIRDLHRVFQETAPRAYPRGFVLSRINPNRYTVASSLVCASPLAVITVVGFLGTRLVSSAAEFRSFLFSMCIDALQSTTLVLFLGFC